MVDVGSATGSVTSGGTLNLANPLTVTADSSIQLPAGGGTATLASLAIGGQTLNILGASTATTLAVAGPVALSGPATFNVGANATLALQGAVSGTGGLTKTGTGGMDMTAADSYSGPTSILGGTTQALAGVGVGGADSLPGDVSLDNATLRLSPSFGTGNAAGFFASYYNVTNSGNVPDFTGLTPVATRVDATIDFPDDSNGFEPGVAGLDTTDSGAEWTGLLDIATAGSYTFQTTSDDGSLLYVDGTQIVNDDGSHAMQTATGSVNLTPGEHVVTVEYVQSGGGAGVIAQYSGPDTGGAMVDIGSLGGTVTNLGGGPASVAMGLANNISIAGASGIDMDFSAISAGTFSAAAGATDAHDRPRGSRWRHLRHLHADRRGHRGRRFTVNTVSANAAVPAAISEATSGVGSLVKTGPDTLSLSAANTYSLGTSLNGGVLNFTALSNLGSGPISFDGGTLQYAAGNTDDISTRSVTIGAGGASIDVGSNNVTFANPVGNGGSGGLTKLGTGGLTLAAPEDFTGDMNMTAGTLTLADPSALAVNTLDCTGGTLAFAGLTAATLGGLSGSQALVLANTSGQGVALTVGGNNVATVFSGPISGADSSELIKTGAATLTLTAPGIAGVLIVDPNNLVLAGGLVSLTSPTVMVGMRLDLEHGGGRSLRRMSRRRLLSRPQRHRPIRRWRHPVGHGHAASERNLVDHRVHHRLVAQHGHGLHTQQRGCDRASYLRLWKRSPRACIDQHGGQPERHGRRRLGGSGGFKRHVYRPGTGNYEVWYQPVEQPGITVTGSVYDGTTLQQTFSLKGDWPDWTLPNVSGPPAGTYPYTTSNYIQNVAWSQGVVYCATGTISVDCDNVNYIALIADPESRTSHSADTTGGPDVTADGVEPADGSIQIAADASTPGAAYNNIVQALSQGIFGYGGRNNGYPELIGDGMLVEAINVSSSNAGSCPCCGAADDVAEFLEPGRNYVPLYGTQYTLVDNGSNLVLTSPNGNVYLFEEPSTDAISPITGTGQGPYSTAPWVETIYADGSIDLATNGDDPSLGFDVPQVIDHYTSAANYAASLVSSEEIYSYNGSGLCSSIAYLNTDSSGALVYTEQLTYGYDGSGDLTSIDTQYAVGTVPGDTTPDSSDWSGDDTYTFSYYTSASGGGFAHGLEEETTPGGTTYDYTYYTDTLDQDRVATVSIDGRPADTYTYSEGTDYCVYEQPFEEGADTYTRVTTETVGDGSTAAFYSNFLGQTVLEEQRASGTDSDTYYQYNAEGDPTSVVSGSGLTGGAASGNYGIPVTPGTGGQVQQYSYQEIPVSDGVFLTTADLLQSTLTSSGLTGTATEQESYTYASQQVQHAGGVGGAQTVYTTATDTTYVAGGGNTTTTSTDYWPGTLQPDWVVTTQPQVDSGLGGTGVTPTTIDWYNYQGELQWEEDPNGFLTYYSYDSAGNVSEMIQNVNSNIELPTEAAPALGLANPNLCPEQRQRNI